MAESLNGQLTKLVSELVDRGLTLQQARKEFEKQFIVASLKSNRGNLSRSAKSLGVHRNTLRNKVSTLGIDAQDPGLHESLLASAALLITPYLLLATNAGVAGAEPKRRPRVSSCRVGRVPRGPRGS